MMALAVVSAAFAASTVIPAKYTCRGEDISPQLSWSNAPQGTVSYALIVDDPDAPAGDWVHWVVFNLPAETTELAEGQPRNFKLLNSAIQGMNDFGRAGYAGPCPPPGKPHRYVFKVYALDTMLNLNNTARKRDVLRAIEGHVLAQGELVGLFKR